MSYSDEYSTVISISAIKNDEYSTRHEAMALLWQAWQKADSRLRRRIVSAINYLRGTALDLLPGATTPNKGSDGRRYGRRV